jgi:GlpG protein
MAVPLANCMRKIGVIESEREAHRFVDYLFSAGIESEVELNRDGHWSVWVVHDEQLEEAETELGLFLRDPGAPRYVEGAREGRELFSRVQKEEARTKSRIIDVRTTWAAVSNVAAGPVTAALMAASILVTIATLFPQLDWVREALSISGWKQRGGWITWDSTLPELRHGEVWRLITPIFLHFGIIHIFFNMMWLRTLGGAIELVDGWIVLLVQVLVFAIVSNLAQFYWSGPFFGGMSGVLYGLFSYTWIRGKYDPASRLALDKNTVTMMIVWFFLCMTGWLGPIANMAHAGGLVAGIVWATVRVRRIPFTDIRF